MCIIYVQIFTVLEEARILVSHKYRITITQYAHISVLPAHVYYLKGAIGSLALGRVVVSSGSGRMMSQQEMPNVCNTGREKHLSLSSPTALSKQDRLCSHRTSGNAKHIQVLMVSTGGEPLLLSPSTGIAIPIMGLFPSCSALCEMRTWRNCIDCWT